MQTPLLPPRDEEPLDVTLSPLLAREVARSLRIQLAIELDRPLAKPLPSREDAARLRSVLDLCVDQLEALAWGDPADDVQMTAPRPLLEAIARDLADAGQECLTNPLGEYRPHAQAERRQGRRMIRAADAINDALASGSRYQMASRRSGWRRSGRAGAVAVGLAP